MVSRANILAINQKWTDVQTAMLVNTHDCKRGIAHDLGLHHHIV